MSENENENEKQESMTANELHVGSMSVDTLKANVYVDLADLTMALEKQGTEQLRALVRLGDQSDTSQKNTESGIAAENSLPSNDQQQQPIAITAGQQASPLNKHDLSVGFGADGGEQQSASTLTKNGKKEAIYGINTDDVDRQVKPDTTVSGQENSELSINVDVKLPDSNHDNKPIAVDTGNENTVYGIKTDNEKPSDSQQQKPVVVEVGHNNAFYGSKTDNKKPSDSQQQKPTVIATSTKNSSVGANTNTDNAVNRRSAALQQVEKKRRITIVDESNKVVSNEGIATTTIARVEPVKPKTESYDPAQARKKRTIEIGAPVESLIPENQAPPATIQATTETPPAQDAKNNGYYMDANGRLRRPDGQFASKIEVRRYNRERNQDVDEKNAAKGENAAGKNQLGIIAKTLAKLSGRAVETNAVNAAGVAAGGSYWLAAKEITDMASDFKESLKLRKINSIKDAKNYTKEKAARVGSFITAPVRAGKRLVNRITGKSNSDTAPKDAPAPVKAAAIPVNSSKTEYEQGQKERSDAARSAEQLEVVEANHAETQQVLEDILDALKPKNASLLDTLLGGKKLLDRVRGRSGNRAGSNRTAGRTTRTNRSKPQRAKGGGLAAAADVLDEISDDTQGVDLGADRSREKTKGDTSVGEKAKARREVRTKGRRAPRVGGKAAVVKQPIGLVSKMLGAIPASFSAIPSMATASGVTSGKILPVMETAGKGVAKASKGVAAVGKGALELTGKGMMAGARALPLVGQALSVGLAGYDAYNGYNDSEAQKGIFSLKDGQEANTLQKSSTAAASVLDLGGLTSGLSGLLGEAAGYFGMSNTQEALTFDSGNMAKTMYDSITGESARKSMGVEAGKDMSIGQNLASGAATVLDMGGLTSFLSKGIGSLAEDLGVTGAKDAMTFDTGSIAKTLYNPFSESGAIGKMATAVTEFSSETIVGAINDLIDTVKRSDDGDTSINNFSSASSWSSGGGAPASNWAGTAKGIDIPAIVQQQQEGSGLPEGYLGGVLGVESRGDPNAKNKSGASGLWQFMPKTVAGMGGFNPFDPQASTQKMIEFTKQNAAYFQKTMGREATGRELYLMHQQGMGGGTKLMKNPDALAANVIGAKAVTQNGGNLNMTARQFAELQMSKYDRQVAANKTKAPFKLGENGEPAKGAKGVPPMLARPSAATTTAPAIPMMLQRLPAPIDIQKAKEAKEATTAKTPNDPLVAKLDPAMAKSLSNIESLLKQQNKASTGNTPAKDTGRNSSVSGHDYVSGHMSDLIRDRR